MKPATLELQNHAPLTTPRDVAPLYCIPFLLGTQYDCWRTKVERRQKRQGVFARKRDFSQHGAADL